MSTVARVSRRIRRTGVATMARRFAHRTATRLSPGARAEARSAAIPWRYRWFRVASVGAVDKLPGGIVVRDLSGRSDLGSGRPLDVVLIPGASIGGPDRLAGSLVSVLIGCERRSIPTILVAMTVADLSTPVTSVCRVVLTDRHDVAEAAMAQVGVERTYLVVPGKGWLPELARLAGLA